MKNCVFCDIMKGKAAASVVYEDALVSAFMTVNPANPGHALVVPQRHVTDLAELGDRLAAHLFGVAVRVTEAVKESGVLCEGIDLFLSNGEPQQEILHLHLHVIPRFQDDGLKIDLGRTRPTRAQLDETALVIRRAYNVLASKTKEN